MPHKCSQTSPLPTHGAAITLLPGTGFFFPAKPDTAFEEATSRHHSTICCATAGSSPSLMSYEQTAHRDQKDAVFSLKPSNPIVSHGSVMLTPLPPSLGEGFWHFSSKAVLLVPWCHSESFKEKNAFMFGSWSLSPTSWTGAETLCSLSPSLSPCTIPCPLKNYID